MIQTDYDTPNSVWPSEQKTMIYNVVYNSSDQRLDYYMKVGNTGKEHFFSRRQMTEQDSKLHLRGLGYEGSMTEESETYYGLLKSNGSTHPEQV